MVGCQCRTRFVIYWLSGLRLISLLSCFVFIFSCDSRSQLIVLCNHSECWSSVTRLTSLTAGHRFSIMSALMVDVARVRQTDCLSWFSVKHCWLKFLISLLKNLSEPKVMGVYSGAQGSVCSCPHTLSEAAIIHYRSLHVLFSRSSSQNEHNFY